MSGFGMALGALGAGLQGWRDGEKMANADRKQVDVDAYEKQARDADSGLLDSRAALAKATLANATTDAANAAELKPMGQQVARAKAQSDVDLAPGQAKIAKSEQDRTINGEMYKKASDLKAGLITEDDAHDYVLGRVAEAATSGDMESATRIMNHAIDAPNLFPSTNGKSKVMKTELVDAPEGTLDGAGNPVTGKSLRTTTEDGKQNYLSAASLNPMLQKLQAQRSMANRVTLKQGEKVIDGVTGKSIAENDNNLAWTGGFNADGSREMVHPSAAGRGGSGAGAAGAKPGKAELDLALKEFMTTTVASALTADQTANIPRVAEKMLASSLGITPKEAVAMAQDAVLGKNVAPSVGRLTGTIDNIYANKTYAGGKAITLAENIGDVKSLGDIRQATLTAQIQESLDVYTHGDQSKANFLRQKVSTPEGAKDAIEQTRRLMGDAEAENLARRIPLLQMLGAPAAAPAQQKPGEEKPSLRNSFGLGGSYAPPADSPAGKAKSMRESTAAKESDRNKDMKEKATTAFSGLDLKDPASASKLQESQMFQYLTVEQKAKIFNAVNGR